MLNAKIVLTVKHKGVFSLFCDLKNETLQHSKNVWLEVTQ